MSAAAVEMPPRWAGRRCSKCGETGHRSDNVRHGGKPTPAFVRAQDAHPWGLNGNTPKGRGKADPGRCSICGSLEHDRRGHGAEAPLRAPTVQPDAHPTAARWTPVNETATDDQGEAPAVARARSRAAVGQDGRVRAHSISPVMQRKELRSLALVVVPDDVPRPRTRGECAQVLRPCPFVSCSMHLYLDVNQESGTIKLNFPDKEPWELEQTCALDVAEAGASTLEAVGGLVNVTRERTRQIETRALEKLRAASADGTETQTSSHFAIEVP